MESRASCMRTKGNATELHHEPRAHFSFEEQNCVARCIPTKQHQERLAQCAENHPGRISSKGHAQP